MKTRCYCPAHSVAHGQQFRREKPVSVARRAVLGIALAASSSAAAPGNGAAPAAEAAPVSPDSSEPQPAPEVKSADGYAGVLALAYGIAPLLALAVGGGLSEAEASDGVAIVAASTLFLAPMGVHLYHGARGRAAGSLGSMVAITLGGSIAGGGVGYLENKIACDSDRDSECPDRGIGTTIVGAVVGGVVGYVVSAVVDVACCSSAPEHSRSTAGTNLGHEALVWVAPVGGAPWGVGVGDRHRSVASRPFEDGLMIGVTLAL